MPKGSRFYQQQNIGLRNSIVLTFDFSAAAAYSSLSLCLCTSGCQPCIL